MKNKKLLYILLPLALIVWGVIIYKITESLKAPAENKLKASTLNIHKRNDVQVPDTFQLLLNYTDPFLSSLAIQKKEIFSVSPSKHPVSYIPMHKAAPTKASVIQVEWPQVLYTGLIENRIKKARVAMLRIGEAEHLISEGQTYEGVTLMKIYGDSLKIMYKKEEKFINRL